MNEKNIKHSIAELEKVRTNRFGIEIELYLFGSVVNSKEFWASEKAAVIPFHQNLQRESLRI